MPRSTSPPALLALLLLPAIHALRGAHPSSGSQLAAGVTCVLRDVPGSGPVALPSSRVNDDYCDCEDGSDEPGTSACPGAVFWCQNARFRPVKVPSSWVDDGNCDCCDGSDEPKGKCPDTCAEEAKRIHAIAKLQADAIREGVSLRAKYAKEGEKAADQDRREIEKLERQLKEIEAQVKKSESRAEGLRKRRDYEDQMRLAVEKHSAPPVNNPAADRGEEHITNPVDSDHDHVEEVDDIADIDDDGADPDDVHPDVDDPPADDKRDEDAHLSDEGKENAEPEKDDVIDHAGPEDIGDADDYKDEDEDDYKDEDDEDDYKDDYDDDPDIESDADSDSDSDSDSDTESKEDNAAQSEKEQGVNETDKESKPEDIDINMVCAELGAKGPNSIVRTINYIKVVISSKLRRILPKAISPPALSSQEGISECLRLVDNAKYEFDTKKRDIEDKLKKLKEKNGIYYGSDGALRKLHGTCIKKAVTQYEFEICPFDLVRQYEHGSSIAVLGRFKGWKGEGADRVMNFAQGDRCWNGPPRSIKVELECGKTEEIVSVEEPNRCAYHMKFKTPAVCESAAADALLADFEQPGSEPKQEL